MNWFYAFNGQQLGPVSDEQLVELLRSGRINLETLVWREGMPNWLPLSAARPNTPPPPPIAANPQLKTCVICGQPFAEGDMIQLNGTWVCASCKPIYLQKLAEGVAPVSTVGLWRMDKQLVTTSETPFPDRCVKCNGPAHGFRLKRVLYWQHPAYYLLILCNLLVLLIVVMIVRKKAILQVGLCENHRALRKRDILIGWCGSLGGLVVAVVGGVALGNSNSTFAGVIVLLGVLTFLFCMIYGLAKSPIVRAAKITKENVFIRGVGKEFLAGLPEWPGAS